MMFQKIRDNKRNYNSFTCNCNYCTLSLNGDINFVSDYLL